MGFPMVKSQLALELVHYRTIDYVCPFFLSGSTHVKRIQTYGARRSIFPPQSIIYEKGDVYYRVKMLERADHEGSLNRFLLWIL